MSFVSIRVPHSTAVALLAAKVSLGGGPESSFHSLSNCVVARPTIVVVSNSQVGEQVAEDLEFFLESETQQSQIIRRFFGWEILPFDELSPAAEISGERISTLHALQNGLPVVVVATIDALMQRVAPTNIFAEQHLSVRVGDILDREQLVHKLAGWGYIRSSLVEEVGQFAVRGLIVDCFAPGVAHPLRFELAGNEVESIRFFDAGSQRSLSTLESFTILPVRELFFPNTGEDTDNAALLNQLRERAAELDLASRELRAMEEIVSTGALWPGMEHLQPIWLNPMASVTDYFPKEARILVWDPLTVSRSADDLENLIQESAQKAQLAGRLFPNPELAYLSARECVQNLFERSDFVLDVRGAALVQTGEMDLSNIISTDEEVSSTQAAHPVHSNADLLARLQRSRSQELPYLPLADEIKQLLTEAYSVVITFRHDARSKRIAELLKSYNLGSHVTELSFGDWFRKVYRTAQNARSSFGAQREVTLLKGFSNHGFRVASERLVLIAENEIFPDIVRKRRAEATSVRRLLGAVSQLKENDFIVHVDHGVGLYRGLAQLTVEGSTSDFLVLEYAEGAKLFLPVENVSKVQRYVGAEGKKPALHKLGGKSWAKTKGKVKENVVELAGQLVKLYAQREIVDGFSFGPRDTDDDRFADTFPYEETPDQERAIEEVLTDMGKDKPMDRLVCGDVGYGKTEVALRAAFKAVNRGKQVAVLVPTTILADQHYSTFRERFADFPIRVGCLSRFFSAEENKKTIADLSAGKIDILIGTHRILQNDVIFPQLGLLIVDEEHRFGVAHKERLKRFRHEIDVLTLSATPIPRTLHMSLISIRDLSVIETPPHNRHAIRTYLSTYSDEIVREAVLRELSRSGQVFYIYNRVETIAQITQELSRLVPEARIAFAHGQMNEKQLEGIMHKFLQHEIDVLVSTTIVESGLDISNANTMIIRNADRFGLAELYQLRGRVGRGARRAYAYLLVGDLQRMSPEARKRLQVLQTLDDLGMGFRLALQDMEIRGAGNLLGKDQSGQIHSVGYELYTQILREAVREIKLRRRGEAPEAPVIDPDMKIGFPAFIPQDYVPDVSEKLLLYQRLVDLDTEEEARQLAEEVEDRFGNPPKEVHELFELMIFRSHLKRFGIVSAVRRDRRLMLTFHPQVSFEPEKITAIISKSKGRFRLLPSGAISVSLESEPESPSDLQAVLLETMQSLRQ